MELKQAVDSRESTNNVSYEELYYAAYNHLTLLHSVIEKAAAGYGSYVLTTN